MEYQVGLNFECHLYAGMGRNYTIGKEIEIPVTIKNIPESEWKNIIFKTSNENIAKITDVEFFPLESNSIFRLV